MASQIKWLRNYLLTVQTNDGGLLTVEPPFSIEFDITRNLLSSANVCSIRVLNLAEQSRSRIRKDISDYGNYKQVVLKAGYGDNLPVIFQGNVTQAWSVREGSNFISQIECYDGGFAFANSLTSEPFTKNTPKTSVLENLASSLQHTSLGVIGNYEGKLQRGNSYNGYPQDVLDELTGGGFFIDREKVFCLQNFECLNGQIQVISSSDGLLGTPVRESTNLRFEMIFEPRVVIGQLIQLQSDTDSNFNGFYKITGIKHRGMISPTVCGDAITSLTLFYGVQNLTTVGDA